jgi:dephospho-CoA kinase
LSAHAAVGIWCHTAVVAAILVTGMSGVGKTTALKELARRGFETVDTDDGDWIEVVEGEPLWREPHIEVLLAAPRPGPLFVQGTVANQWCFYDRFSAIVLLTAPIEVILERLRTRTTNEFGKSPQQRERILRDIAATEPLLRSAATHEIDTSQPLPKVVDSLIRIAQGS